MISYTHFTQYGPHIGPLWPPNTVTAFLSWSIPQVEPSPVAVGLPLYYLYMFLFILRYETGKLVFVHLLRRNTTGKYEAHRCSYHNFIRIVCRELLDTYGGHGQGKGILTCFTSVRRDRCRLCYGPPRGRNSIKLNPQTDSFVIRNAPSARSTQRSRECDWVRAETQSSVR
jgi:hypothetical protein